MVNRANSINGQSIDRHPFSDREGLGIYAKGTTVIAAQALQPGLIRTPEGEMTFQAGDWILTDNPPTHAWPVRQQVFQTTYSLFQKLEPGQYPTSEPVERRDDPALSAPPVNAGELKEAGVPEAAVATGNEGDRPPPETEPALPTEPDPPKAKKTGRGIADSKSLGLEE